MSKPYKRVVRGTHWFVSINELTKPLSVVLQTLTIQSRYRDKEPIQVYRLTKNSVGIPLYYRDMSKHAEEVRDITVEGAPVEIGFKSELRERQVPVHEQFVQALASGKRGFLVKAPTGTGKTVMALKMLSELGRPSLIVVPRDAIVKQWRERILQHTDLTEDDIGIAQQSQCDFRGKKIVIGMLQSLYKDKYSAEFKQWPGVVVFDEVHTTGANEFSKVVTMFPARYRVGLSATIDRVDGFDAVYKYHVGETTLTMAGGTDVQPMVFLRVYTAKKKHPYVERVKDSKSRRGIIISWLVKDPVRNALIAVYIKKFVESGRRTLMLTDRKDQIKLIRELLMARHKFLPNQVGVFTSETSDVERRRVLTYCPIILATTGCMNMAVDVPDLRALVWGTPMSNIEQGLGRILRMCENAKDPVALDLIDDALMDTLKWATGRQRHYRKAKVKLIHVKN